ncbi:MAG TPA: SPFH domain-containing protein [Pseudomonadota bacterium]|nr:SPFH domain-containing protein [Pseudomonadota bacterium]
MRNQHRFLRCLSALRSCRKTAGWSLLLLPLFLLQIGCTTYSTESTQVGVRTRKWFSPGIERRIYEPGATYLFFPFQSDWVTFDIMTQKLEMSSSKNRGDRPGDDAIVLKSRDGNDISIDVTVTWRIDPLKAPDILARGAASTEEIKEELVRPACRAYVRDAFNELHSEEFFERKKLLEKANKAKAKLTKELEAEGIILEDVMPGEQRFNTEYERVIHDRKIAEQNAERLKSEAQAAEAEQTRQLEKARGDVQSQIAEAKGRVERIRISADRALYENERTAKALLAEATARAKGIEKQNRAMAGTGGRTAVKLRIADALAGKPILIVPSATGTNLQKLDMTRILEAVMAKEAVAPSTPEETE